MVNARDITAAKQKARDQHIDSDGRSNADHIFVHVPQILGVEGWHRVSEGESAFDKEHVWRRNGNAALVFMERSPYGWTVETRGDVEEVSEDFNFNGRKKAEARLVGVMK